GVERVAQIRVLAADLRPERGQLRVDEGARQRDEAAHDPRPQDQEGRVDLPRDHVGVHEDAGADDAAHHDHGGVEQPEPASEGGHGPGEYMMRSSLLPGGAISQRPFPPPPWGGTGWGANE